MDKMIFGESYLKSYLREEEIRAAIYSRRGMLQEVLAGEASQAEFLGWHKVETWGVSQVNELEALAKKVQEEAEVFVLIGVGGSNQGARAGLKALLPNGKTEVVYAGCNLSESYMERLLKYLDGKSVYIDCIAKNFATLEPGSAFRVLRHYMERRYGKEEAARRIAVTASPGENLLRKMGEERGYDVVTFPTEIGGRFTVLSPVELFPMAAGGVDIQKMLEGAKAMEEHLKNTPLEENEAVRYAIIRNLLYKKGYKVEVLADFEPTMEYFAKWWVQLFGESEGKDGCGIYPTACNYSEDLHSLGQYMQEGQRILMETFIHILEEPGEVKFEPEPMNADGFSYLDGKDFTDLNAAAYQATIEAHAGGGVPCMEITVPKLNEYYLGQLFYFFMMSCYLSGRIHDVNPFDQNGVEAYKNKMFSILKK